MAPRLNMVQNHLSTETLPVFGKNTKHSKGIDCPLGLIQTIVEKKPFHRTVFKTIEKQPQKIQSITNVTQS